ncbi:MAG TPA: hypothetical protein VFQ43_21435 [Nitrososphaera sp.]|nr:hypothetical protein [Nitrososphaera sp.]
MKFKKGDVVKLIDSGGTTGRLLLEANPTGIFTVAERESSDPKRTEILKLKEYGGLAYSYRFDKWIPSIPIDVSEEYEEIMKLQELVDTIKAGG